MRCKRKRAMMKERTEQKRNKRKMRTECRICKKRKRGTGLPTVNTPLDVYGTDTLFCASNDAWCMVQAMSVVSVVSGSIRRSHICCSCDSLLPCVVLDRLVRCDGRGLPGPFFVFLFVCLFPPPPATPSSLSPA